MPSAFPHHYEIELNWEKDHHATLSGKDKPTLIGGPPPQFDGKSEWWSPEELLLSSLNLCLLTTFLSLSSKKEIELRDYQCKAHGVLDKTKEGLVFTELCLEVSLTVPEMQTAMVSQLIESAKRYCIISNSLKPAITLKTTVHAG